MYRKASCVLAQTVCDQRKFKEVHGIDAVLAHEQAAEPSFGVRRTYDGERPLSVAWVGRCIALKAMPILLQALKNPALRGRVALHIVGDEPHRRKWEAQAGRLGIADQCTWHGWQP